MTTGSWSTLVTTIVGTECSSNSQLHNGMTVSWTGTDNVVKRNPRLRWRDRRIANYVYDPKRLYAGGPAKSPTDMQEALTRASASTSLFDRAREQRFRVAENLGTYTEEFLQYNAPHQYSKTWTGYAQSVFRFRGAGGTLYDGAVGSCGGGPFGPFPSPWTEVHDYKLLDRLRGKIVGSDFNLASFLGAEGKDVVNHLAHTANRIYTSMKYARKGLITQATRHLLADGRAYKAKMSKADLALQQDIYRDLLEGVAGKSRGLSWASVPANAWLEWHLAVRPLLGDVVAAAEQLAHITQMPRKQTIRVGVTARSNLDEAGVGSAAWKEYRRSVRKNITAYFIHLPEPTSFLGLQDPEVTIWNALPLSFVSDYMYNIGGFLEARATRAALPTAVYVISTLDKTHANHLMVAGGWNVVVDGDEQRYWRGDFNRSIAATLPVPTPTFKPYGAFKSWMRAATVVSLAAIAGDREVLQRYLRG
jgi:hypothetical protein